MTNTFTSIHSTKANMVASMLPTLSAIIAEYRMAYKAYEVLFDKYNKIFDECENENLYEAYYTVSNNFSKKSDFLEDEFDMIADMINRTIDSCINEYERYEEFDDKDASDACSAVLANDAYLNRMGLVKRSCCGNYYIDKSSAPYHCKID